MEKKVVKKIELKEEELSKGDCKIVCVRMNNSLN